MIDLGDLERAGYRLNPPLMPDSVGCYVKKLVGPNSVLLGVHVKLHTLEATAVCRTDAGLEFSVAFVLRDQDTVSSMEMFFIDLWTLMRDRTV